MSLALVVALAMVALNSAIVTDRGRDAVALAILVVDDDEAKAARLTTVSRPSSGVSSSRPRLRRPERKCISSSE